MDIILLFSNLIHLRSERYHILMQFSANLFPIQDGAKETSLRKLALVFANGTNSRILVTNNTICLSTL